MEMNLCLAVGVCDLIIVNLAEPVVGGDGTGVGQDQTTHRIGYGRILLDSPVVNLQVIIYQILIVQEGGINVSHLFPLTAVKDISLGHIGIAGLGKHLFHTVLDIFHGNLFIDDLTLEVRRHMKRNQLNNAGMGLLLQGMEGLGDGSTDLGNLKIRYLAVSFNNLIHNIFPLLKNL